MTNEPQSAGLDKERAASDTLGFAERLMFELISDLEGHDTDIAGALRRRFELYQSATKERAAALLERLETLTAERAELRATLEFYANEKHYDEDGAPGKAVFSDVPGEPREYDFEPDLGQRARAALEPQPETKHE